MMLVHGVFPVEIYDSLMLKFARWRSLIVSKLKKRGTEQQNHAQSFYKFVEESSQQIRSHPVSWNKKNIAFEGL